ncbi:MarR family winged helix-turn-helix transcriptional regulator [Microbacterium immunditiarum]|uniref:DNA-binding MarR family transcriptional regulator n=1 Tax=Microbacterium immunditiarum TaxID=337480 RepID=A0A7Y9KK55_9MICO|nr:MarR family transcriptional regulator [Microbacterium immunditiarum]NYE18863.1 DNA-binding MarR family transcriptional regulator [Microbacterium immunditiarum]
MKTDAPTSAGDLDTATLLSLAGSLAEGAVIEAVRARGYEVTRAHGYVFQRLLTGDQTITALAADLRITQQGASKHVAELERLGLVSRRVAPDDRRSRIVGLTDAGREVIDAARRARTEFEARVRAIVGDDLLAATRRALAMVLDEGGTSAHIADRSVPLDE